MKIVNFCLACLFLAASSGVWAEPFRKILFVVVPGNSAGQIRLGQPLPQDFLLKLGPPRKKTSHKWLWSKAPDGPNFEDGIIIKLDDKGLVDSVMLANVPFKTDRGLTMGDSRKRALQLYPEGSVPGRYKSGAPWSLPGAWFEFHQDKLFLVAIHPPISK